MYLVTSPAPKIYNYIDIIQFFFRKIMKNRLQQQKQKFRMMVKTHGGLMTLFFWWWGRAGWGPVVVHHIFLGVFVGLPI